MSALSVLVGFKVTFKQHLKFQLLKFQHFNIKLRLYEAKQMYLDNFENTLRICSNNDIQMGFFS